MTEGTEQNFKMFAPLEYYRMTIFVRLVALHGRFISKLYFYIMIYATYSVTIVGFANYQRRGHLA